MRKIQLFMCFCLVAVFALPFSLISSGQKRTLKPIIKKSAKYSPTVVSMLFKLKAKKSKKSLVKASHTHFLLVNAAEKIQRGKTERKIQAYVLSVKDSQFARVKSSVLNYADNLTAVSDRTIANIKNKIDAGIQKNVRGAVITELNSAKLNDLMRGNSIRLSNSALVAEGADDIIEGGLSTGGAFVGAGAQFGSAVTVAEVIGAGAAIEIAAAGLAVGAAGYGGYQIGSGLLSVTGANDGYTLGDFLYDLTHPDDAGNPIWSSDDDGAAGNSNTNGGNTGNTGNAGNTGNTGNTGNSNDGNSNSGNSNSNDNSNSGSNSDSNDNSGNDNSNSNSNSEGGDDGTPTGDEEKADAGKNIAFLIAMGMFSGSTLERSILTRPVTMLGEPLLDSESSGTNLNFMILADTFLHGNHFKMLERNLNARRNAAGTPIEDENSSAGAGLIVDYTKCPIIDFNSMVFQNFLKSSATLRRIAVKKTK